MREICAFVEAAGGKIPRASQEALCEAVRQGKQLGAKTTALVLGNAISQRLIEQIGAHGPDRIMIAEDQALSPYAPRAYADRLERLLRVHRPDALLMGSSVISQEVAPRLAYRLGCGVVTEATFLRPRGDGFVVTRPAFRPHASMLVSFQTTGLQIISLASGVVDVEKVKLGLPYVVQHTKQHSTFKADAITLEAVAGEMTSALPLVDAGVIVAGGRGMKSKENFGLLEELAEVLGGTVGATRMAVDLGWRARDRMVGISGAVVSPDLYIACGISGASQHVVGMRSSRTVVAINTDPGAPIFRLASLGIIGDVRDVIPVMISAFKRCKSERMRDSETDRMSALS